MITFYILAAFSALFAVPLTFKFFGDGLIKNEVLMLGVCIFILAISVGVVSGQVAAPFLVLK